MSWEQAEVARSLARAPEAQDRFVSGSGLPVDRLYTPLEVPGFDYLQELGFPGLFPFTRGVQPTMYRGRPWTMRQYAGFGSAEETNRRFRYLLEHGQTGLSVAFDLPTQIGYDSDHLLSGGEVGKVGVAVDSVDDMAMLFQGIPLDKVSTSMTINAPAIVLLAMYVVVAEEQGVAPGALSGTVQNDILKEYVARGTYIFPPRPSMRLVTDIFRYCSRHLPEWNTISISGYHIREAGATAVQEVAFTLANGLAYVDAARQAGLDIDAFAPRLSFFFNAHSDLFEEVAKFRAARRLWARLMRERMKAKNPRSWMLRFHAQTAGSTLTAQQPDNNVVRVALQALAAVLGGAQSLHTNSRDEALALPSEESVRIALRTQQVIAFESGVAASADPLGGSYLVENLTRTVEEGALAYLERIDALGGAVAAIERGFMQDEIHRSAYQTQLQLESGKRQVVGANCFQDDQAPSSPGKAMGLRLDPRVEDRQRRRLEALRRSRDAGAVTGALEALAAAAREAAAELFPPILDAVRSRASLGEVCGTLREVFGEHEPSVAG